MPNWSISCNGIRHSTKEKMSSDHVFRHHVTEVSCLILHLLHNPDSWSNSPNSTQYKPQERNS